MLLRRYWDRYWTWRNNEGRIIHTLVWARIKLLLGLGFTGIQQSGVDVAALVTQKAEYQAAVRIAFAILAVDGTLSEWARRHKADDLYQPKESV